MSIRWRFALLLVAGAILASVVAASAAVFTTNRILIREVDDFLRTRTQLVLEIRVGQIVDEADGKTPVVLSSIDDLAAGRRFLAQASARDVVVQWNDVDGELLIAFAETLVLPAVDPPAEGRRRLDTITLADTTFRRSVVVGRHGGVIQVARDITAEQSIIRTLRARIIAVGIVIAAVVGAGGWLAAKRVVKPIEQLTDAAEEVARTPELLRPIDATGAGEVGRLAGSFNTMLAALSESRDQQRRLVQDASHELRTPLTSLRTNIEVLLRGAELPDEEKGRLLEDIDLELKELTTLVTEVVGLATDTSLDREEQATVGLRLVVDEVVERARRRIEHPIEVHGSGPEISIQRADVERAIGNLIENASKWSDPSTAIKVTVAGGSVSVRDHGAGIAEADLPYVFDRFFRADEARSKPGSGLGLSIVRQVVERHGGTVNATNAPDGGAIVGFEIPL